MNDPQVEMRLGRPGDTEHINNTMIFHRISCSHQGAMLINLVQCISGTEWGGRAAPDDIMAKALVLVQRTFQTCLDHGWAVRLPSADEVLHIEERNGAGFTTRK